MNLLKVSDRSLEPVTFIRTFFYSRLAFERTDWPIKAVDFQKTKIITQSRINTADSYFKNGQSDCRSHSTKIRANLSTLQVYLCYECEAWKSRTFLLPYMNSNLLYTLHEPTP